MWGHLSISLIAIARAMEIAPVLHELSGLIISAGRRSVKEQIEAITGSFRPVLHRNVIYGKQAKD
jgi:hypothetical protein